MSDQELVESAKQQKELGNQLFKEKQFNKAKTHYIDGIQYLDTVKDQDEETKKLKVTCHQNLSVCHNFTGEYKETILQCTSAIELDSKASKAFYLRSIAHMKQQAFDEAMDDMKQAIKLNPQDKKLR